MYWVDLLQAKLNLQQMQVNLGPVQYYMLCKKIVVTNDYNNAFHILIASCNISLPDVTFGGGSLFFLCLKFSYQGHNTVYVILQCSILPFSHIQIMHNQILYPSCSVPLSLMCLQTFLAAMKSQDPVMKPLSILLRTGGSRSLAVAATTTIF